MSNGFGQNPKSQTVYGGPTIQTKEGTVYNGPVAGGPVYQGPAATTPYNPSLQALRSAPRAVNAGARKGSNIFYVIAGFTAVRTLLLFAGVQQLTLGANRMVAGDPQSILMVNGLIIAIFVALGIFTRRGSKTTLLIGMLLYAADTVLLLIGDASANAIYIGVHALFLYYLFSAYRQFAD
jgi:hypothetical protein